MQHRLVGRSFNSTRQTMQTLKSLFITCLILGGAFLAYDYYLAPDGDKMVFKRPTASREVASPSPAGGALPPAPVLPADTQKGPPPPSASATVAPSSAPVAASPPATTPPERTAPGGFAAPAIPDVARATDNWMHIPPTAFPRPVKLNKAISFKTSFGVTEVAAGSEVTAIAAREGMATVAPNAQSALRTTVPIDATDLKATLTTVYDAWRARRVEDARRAWEQRDSGPAPAQAPQLAGDVKPQMASDGTYPLLLASMKSGQVTEITPTNVRRWGQPEKGQFKSESCWDVPVEFDAQTAFGKISSEAIAKVLHGRVAGWFYKGSGESVP
jgi:hypothetical protein